VEVLAWFLVACLTIALFLAAKQIGDQRREIRSLRKQIDRQDLANAILSAGFLVDVLGPSIQAALSPRPAAGVEPPSPPPPRSGSEPVSIV